MKIIHLFDNITHKSEIQPLWGYSLFLQMENVNILMDTGSDGRMLLKNMKILDVDPSSIDCLFLSHNHWDHIGGLDSILELNPEVQLIVPNSLSDHLLDDLHRRELDLTVVGSSPHTIAGGIYSTGTLEGSEPEQSLVIEMKQGLLVVTGCAHPGLDQILGVCQDHFTSPFYMIMGGFHLLKSNKSVIESTLRMLKELGVQYIAPSHCTGEKALNLMREHFPEQFIESGAGKIYTV